MPTRELKSDPPEKPRSMKSIPKTRMEILENSSHWPHWEEADKFNKFQFEFLWGKD